MNDCICTEYDTRGRSVCGCECPVHPLNGDCPGVRGKPCSQRTHNSIQCFGCFAEEERQELAELLRITPKKVRDHIENLARQLDTARKRRRNDTHVFKAMRKRISDEEMKTIYEESKATADAEIARLNKLRQPKNLDQPMTF